MRLLSLCEGPSRPDGLDKFVEAWGAAIDVYDLELSCDHDLTDEGVWSNIRTAINEGRYHGGGAAPSCGTFCANRGFGPGPRQVRGPLPPGLYGLKHLTPEEKESVRLGTCLALRCLEMCTLFHALGFPFWLENPKRRAGAPSLFALLEALEVASLKGVAFVAFVQCLLGAWTSKPTELLHYLIDFSMLSDKCTHPSVWWAQPWNGRTHFGPHPPLRGRQWMIPWRDWRRDMFRPREPAGPFISRSMAAYLADLNRTIADQWVRAAVGV